MPIKKAFIKDMVVLAGTLAVVNLGIAGIVSLALRRIEKMKKKTDDC